LIQINAASARLYIETVSIFSFQRAALSMVASTPTQPLIGGIQRVIGSKLREDRHIGEMMPEIGTATKLPLNFFHYAAGA
jgi:hypothetical protein